MARVAAASWNALDALLLTTLDQAQYFVSRPRGPLVPETFRPTPALFQRGRNAFWLGTGYGANGRIQTNTGFFYFR